MSPFLLTVSVPQAAIQPDGLNCGRNVGLNVGLNVSALTVRSQSSDALKYRRLGSWALLPISLTSPRSTRLANRVRAARELRLICVANSVVEWP